MHNGWWYGCLQYVGLSVRPIVVLIYNWRMMPHTIHYHGDERRLRARQTACTAIVLVLLLAQKWAQTKSPIWAYMPNLHLHYGHLRTSTQLRNVAITATFFRNLICAPAQNSWLSKHCQEVQSQVDHVTLIRIIMLIDLNVNWLKASVNWIKKS